MFQLDSSIPPFHARSFWAVKRHCTGTGKSVQNKGSAMLLLLGQSQEWKFFFSLCIPLNSAVAVNSASYSPGPVFIWLHTTSAVSSSLSGYKGPCPLPSSCRVSKLPCLHQRGLQDEGSRRRFLRLCPGLYFSTHLGLQQEQNNAMAFLL